MGKIFVSYRRDDSADSTGRLFDRLKDHFGIDSLVRDVDSIPTGVDFRQYLAGEVNRCQVLLAVIGRSWADIKDGSGKRRLDNPSDMVRIEIETALQRNIPIIPVIVAGAPFPDEAKLPPSMRGLVNRNGVFVRPDPDFHQDVDRLLGSLEGVLKVTGGKKPAALKAKAQTAPAAGGGGKLGLIIGVVVALIGLLAVGGVGFWLMQRTQGPTTATFTRVAPTEPKDEKVEAKVKKPPEKKDDKAAPDKKDDKTPPEKKVETPPATQGIRGATPAVRKKAMAWIREANKFGPTTRIVTDTAGAVEKADNCFIIVTGATLVKSKKTTVIAGRGDSFMLFELTDQQARPFRPGLQERWAGEDRELRLTTPEVLLANPRVENADRNPREGLRGSVDYTRTVKREGRLFLRLMYSMDEKWHRLKRPVTLTADQGNLNFSHPNALAKVPPGPLLLFVELVDESGAEPTIVSNPVGVVVSLTE
jgi:hypothetical protein